MNSPARWAAGLAALCLALTVPADACFDDTPGREGVDPCGPIINPVCTPGTEFQEDPATFYQTKHGTEVGTYLPELTSSITGTRCFSVIRFADGAWGTGVEWLFLDDGPGEFNRRVSSDGLVFDPNTNPPLTTGFSDFAGLLNANGSPIQVNAIQCPDPVQLRADSLDIFFNAKTEGTDTWEVWQATSVDRGQTWRNFRRVVRASTDLCSYPYMPSVVKRRDGVLVMAVHWVHKAPAATHGRFSADDAIRFFTSTDQLTWYPLLVGGQLVTFPHTDDFDPALLRFDSGAANRPRLSRDWYDSSKLHLFYAGYPLGDVPCGQGPVRQGAAIGHAESLDGGKTWVNREPLHLPLDPLLGQLYPDLAVKPAVVRHSTGGRKYRLYFEGGFSQSGFYAYDYDATNFPPPAAEPLRQEAVAPDPDTSRPPVQVRSIPNPTTGETAVTLDFAGLQAPADVELAVFDIQGRLVKKLWSGSSQSAPREITWDGLSRSGSRVATGRYLVQVRSGTASLGSHWVTILR